MLDHVSMQCRDMAASSAFYDAVLAPLGGQRILDFGGAIGYGVPPQPDFWISQQATGEGFRESHIAFTASDRASVRAFFDAAVSEETALMQHDHAVCQPPHQLHIVLDDDNAQIELLPRPLDGVDDGGGLVVRQARAWLI